MFADSGGGGGRSGTNLLDTLANLFSSAAAAEGGKGAPAQPQRTGTPLARWEAPERPESQFSGDPRSMPTEWVAIGGSPGGRGGPRLNEDSVTKVEDGKTYLLNPDYKKQMAERELPASQEAMDAYEQRVARMKGLGLIADDLGMKAGALTTVDLPKTTELTREMYESMSPRQQRAIDFNTMLSDAVKRDIKNQGKYEPGENQRKAYDHLVGETFGEGRGADNDFYAPETMAVLQQLNLKDKAGDLDDYLGMKVTITTDDLKKLDDRLPPSTSSANAAERGQEEWLAQDPNGANRLQLQSQITNQVEALNATLAKGNQILQSFNATARIQRGDQVTAFGGAPGMPKMLPGFDTSTEAGQAINFLFDKLTSANPEQAREGIGILETEYPDQVKNFWSYVNAQLENAERYDLPLGDKTPEQMRDLLGLKGE